MREIFKKRKIRRMPWKRIIKIKNKVKIYQIKNNKKKN